MNNNYSEVKQKKFNWIPEKFSKVILQCYKVLDRHVLYILDLILSRALTLRTKTTVL